MRTYFLLAVLLLSTSLCFSQTILYNQDGVMLLFKNKTLKTVYCEIAKKNMYFVQSSVYILNASGKNLQISAAVFVPEETMISGKCVTQYGVNDLGDYLINFNSHLVKNKTKVVKITSSWVFEERYTPDFSVSEITAEQFKPLRYNRTTLNSY